MNQWVWGMIIVVTITTACSIKIGGGRLCFLDHADLTVTTHHDHADPNAH